MSTFFCLMRRISTCWLIQTLCNSDYLVYLVPISSHWGQILFTRRVVKHWNRLLRETAESPSLEIFETQLGVKFSWWMLKLECCEQDLNQEEIRSYLNHSKSAVFSVCMSSVPLNSIFPSRRSYQWIQRRKYHLHTSLALFLIFPSLLFFLQNFCVSYFSLK